MTNTDGGELKICLLLVVTMFYLDIVLITFCVHKTPKWSNNSCLTSAFFPQILMVLPTLPCEQGKGGGWFALYIIVSSDIQ